MSEIGQRLSFSDRLWGWRELHRFGWVSFYRMFPAPILLFTTVPRVILQSTFFVLVTQVVGGHAAAEFVLIGVTAATMTVFTVTTICEVTILDAESRTFAQHLRAPTHPATAWLIRSVPHVVGAVLSAMLTIVIVAPLTGHGALVDDLLRAMPIYCLIALTASVAGLVIGISSSPSENYILASNVLGYVILIGSGAVIPLDRLGPFTVLTSIVPMQHGILAVRQFIDGQPWMAEAALELAVGLLWGIAAWASTTRQMRRARIAGIGI